MRFIFILFISFTFAQTDDNKRKVDISIPKNKLVIPNVTPINPNSFTFKKEIENSKEEACINLTKKFDKYNGEIVV
mgnify:CR=1 FL=1